MVNLTTILENVCQIPDLWKYVLVAHYDYRLYFFLNFVSSCESPVIVQEF